MMLEILKFIFSDVWYYLGTLLLIAIIPTTASNLRGIIQINHTHVTRGESTKVRESDS